MWTSFVSSMSNTDRADWGSWKLSRWNEVDQGNQVMPLSQNKGCDVDLTEQKKCGIVGICGLEDRKGGLCGTLEVG